jgi:hypothetical protein
MNMIADIKETPQSSHSNKETGLTTTMVAAESRS